MTTSSKKRTRFSSPVEGGASPEVTNEAKRVYVIDEDQAVLDVLQLMLTQAGYDVQTFQSSARFAEESPHLIPGVVVMDQVLKQIVRVVLVTALPRTGLGATFKKSGAVMVLDKEFHRQELIEAVEESFRQIQDAGSQDQPLPPVLQKPEEGSSLNLLSRREHEVIHLVCTGATNKAIAIQLGISTKTIEKYRSTAMKKLKVTSVAGLVRLIDRG
ncbi:MAG: LuxR C-terminal-related transcriptional regulator [Planctomycetaceae bacterium]